MLRFYSFTFCSILWNLYGQRQDKSLNRTIEKEYYEYYYNSFIESY